MKMYRITSPSGNLELTKDEVIELAKFQAFISNYSSIIVSFKDCIDFLKEQGFEVIKYVRL